MISVAQDSPLKLSDADSLVEPTPSVCAYCARVVGGGPFVVWQLVDGPISLHQDCATTFGANLIGDSRECRLASGGRHWTLRAARAAGYGMRQAEATR